MAARTSLFLITFLLGTRISPDFTSWLIVWNVGQGQWATISDETGCWHFDIGGEFAPWTAIMKECRAVKNFVSLSHWDWDHVGLVGKARFYLPNICLLSPPQGRGSERKEKQLRGLESCTTNKPYALWDGATNKTANASSRVILWRQVLLPGDSSRDQEKIWIDKLDVLSARILVLGHHGSATSTSRELIEKLKSARISIASARRSRYGHPHPRVTEALSKIGIPVLRTEEWGSIRIPL